VTSGAPDRVVVGRQAIHGRDFEVVGYEVRFGRGVAARTEEPARVDFDGLHLVVDRLVGDKQVFVDADRALVTDPVRLSLLPSRSVIEVRPELAADDTALAACRTLAELGFPIAVDDVSCTDGIERLLSVADIVKLDGGRLAPWEFARLADACRAFDVRVLANGVDTAQQLDLLLDASVDLFQGRALSAPRDVSGPTIGTVDLARLQMSASVLTQQLDFFEIEEMLRTEPGLTYQVLQLASLGRPGETRRAVNSLREALVLAGSWRIQSWISMLLACPADDVARDAVAAALTRARAAELLAATVGATTRTAFAAGMISSFEELLGIPAAQLEATLPLSDELRAAAFGGEVPLARLVRDIAEHQAGAPGPTRTGLSADEFDDAMAAAVHWALTAVGVLA
jgi:EAL and modified HD-GYP domain-containing signal transduction protein